MLDNIVELRLGIKPNSNQSRNTVNGGKRNIICTFKGAGGSISTLENRVGDTTYSGIIPFQKIIDNEYIDKPIINNLLALQNGKALDLSQPIVYNHQTYLPTKIRYTIDSNYSQWRNLVSKLENMDEKLTLSLYFDISRINSSNYQVIQIKEESYLNIVINPIFFELKKEIYWLPEAGKPLQFPRYEDPEGNFGFYGNDQLYPIPKRILDVVCKDYSADTLYSTDTPEYEIGDASVKRVMLALEKLENITAYPTGENSIADIKFKWDLIVKVNDKHYPLQIKSSEIQAKEDWQIYKELWLDRKIPFLPAIVWTNFASSIDAMAKQFAQLFDVEFKKELPIVNNNINSQIVENKYQIPQHIDQVKTGKKAHKYLLKALYEAAERGTWNKAVEDLLQEVVDRGKNPAYQLINHCRSIAKARTIQAEVLESLEQNQQE
ncbi:hypothetical protein IQ227_12735 [Anabaena aphanizomenioides LEGE 00250]|uniref:Uncharacterized protein n=1 Tax=Sphaerospermopsis aphanizomenoides LEGE 00250 TaxID=2777972 RepID=A0ABR9VHI4_9CYAN|nr:hypothetical protein [Sphaerospermopsis aphanizomenoides]MBE9236865.1 hypothetical protein [Sphaerospermopsis aphanizomenoides LEGE 00250]